MIFRRPRWAQKWKSEYYAGESMDFVENRHSMQARARFLRYYAGETMDFEISQGNMKPCKNEKVNITQARAWFSGDLGGRNNEKVNIMQARAWFAGDLGGHKNEKVNIMNLQTGIPERKPPNGNLQAEAISFQKSVAEPRVQTSIHININTHKQMASAHPRRLR